MTTTEPNSGTTATQSKSDLKTTTFSDNKNKTSLLTNVTITPNPVPLTEEITAASPEPDEKTTDYITITEPPPYIATGEEPTIYDYRTSPLELDATTIVD